MPPASPRANRRFVRLALWTTVLTYALILVGSLVRASGAGLGCPDWPKCFGSWIPPSSVEALPAQFDPSLFNPTLMWTEYLNRLLGVIVGFFILATMVSAWRHHRRNAHVLAPTVLAFVLTGYEGWLGGRVVAHELAPWIVTVHLVVAIIIVLLLLYATVYTMYRRPAAGQTEGEPVTADPGLVRSRRRLVAVVAAMILVTLIQVAVGTQVRGTVDDVVGAGVPRSGALAAVGPVDDLHRTTALVVMLLSLLALLLVWARYRRDAVVMQWTCAVVALAAMQIVLGGVLAYAALPPAAQVLHVTIASLLMGAQMVQLLVVWWE
jgi:cytochrome c oxidase assembly protein subunit 15